MTQELSPQVPPPEEEGLEVFDPPDLLRGPWPKEWMYPFLDTLRTAHGNVRVACLKVGVSRSTAIAWKARFSRFSAAWDMCVDEAVDVLEEEAWNRALFNTRSDALLWNMLAALKRERFGPRVEINIKTTHLIEELAKTHGLSPAEIIAEAEEILVAARASGG